MGLISVPTDSFAAIGARMGQAVMRRMANAVATVQGVPDLAVHFSEHPSREVVGGVLAQTHAVMVTMLAADMPAATDQGSPVQIGAHAWVVATQPELDARTGLVSFALEVA